jgi:hypothetical protein
VKKWKKAGNVRGMKDDRDRSSECVRQEGRNWQRERETEQKQIYKDKQTDIRCTDRYTAEKQTDEVNMRIDVQSESWPSAEGEKHRNDRRIKGENVDRQIDR